MAAGLATAWPVLSVREPGGVSAGLLLWRRPQVHSTHPHCDGRRVLHSVEVREGEMVTMGSISGESKANDCQSENSD